MNYMERPEGNYDFGIEGDPLDDETFELPSTSTTVEKRKITEKELDRYAEIHGSYEEVYRIFGITPEDIIYENSFENERLGSVEKALASVAISNSDDGKANESSKDMEKKVEDVNVRKERVVTYDPPYSEIREYCRRHHCSSTEAYEALVEYDD